VAGLLAGFAIFPAVFSFGLEPASGPGLIFSTLPQTFAMMPAGWIFGLLFFLGLFGAAYLSDVAAFEVLVGGMVDNWAIERKKAVMMACCICFFLAIPPMINFKIFVPWDLTFGSGMQVVGSFMAVMTTAWFIKRAETLRELAASNRAPYLTFLYWWIRIVVPAAILFVGVNWLLESVFNINLLG
jgi:NSS family neurotransmitter:Na+ symporter